MGNRGRKRDEGTPDARVSDEAGAATGVALVEEQALELVLVHARLSAAHDGLVRLTGQSRSVPHHLNLLGRLDHTALAHVAIQPLSVDIVALNALERGLRARALRIGNGRMGYSTTRQGTYRL